MSWNLHTDPTKSEEAKVKVDELELAGAAPEVAEQVEVAKKYAKEILGAGVVGPADSQYVVNLSGHANPDHVLPAGNEADRVAIMVTQVSPAPAASQEEQAQSPEGEAPAPAESSEPSEDAGETPPAENQSEEGTTTPPPAEGTYPSE